MKKANKKKTINLKKVPCFKQYVDPKEASKKQLKITGLYTIAHKVITIPPSVNTQRTADTLRLLTDKQPTMTSSVCINISTKPIKSYKTKVDILTDELMETIRKKLLEIRIKQKSALNTRNSLEIKLIESKDRLRTALDDLESQRKRLRHLKFVKIKLESDCKFLQNNINQVKEKICCIKRSNSDCIKAMNTEIIGTGNRRVQIYSELKDELKMKTESEKDFEMKKANYLSLIDMSIEERVPVY